MLHSILVQFKVALRCCVSAYSTHSIHKEGGGDYSHFIHKAKEVGPQSIKGIDYGYKGGRYLGCKVTFWNQTMWDHGGGHVALHTITSWALIYFGSSVQLCCVSSRQWWWRSSSYARSSYTRPRDWFKETSGFDFEYSSYIQLRLFFFFLPIFSPEANMIFFHVNHIAICMWNSLKFGLSTLYLICARPPREE